MIYIKEFYDFINDNNSIDYSEFDINQTNNDMFNYIYDFSPSYIKEYIDSLKGIDQRRDYHPEGSVFNHIKTVTNRLSKTKNINLILSGFLHDTGKDRVEKNEDGIIMHPGHEIPSADLIKIGSPWREWIKKMGGNPYIIEFIIRNHMRMKDMKDNNKNKKWYNNLNDNLKFYMDTFSKYDKGGF